MSVPTAIFIDTSIFYEQNYNFSSATMSAFLKVAEDSKLTLLLPDTTQREIERHIKDRSQEVIKALKEAKRKAPFLTKWENWPFEGDDCTLSFQLRRIAQKEWDVFVKHFSVVKLGYDGISLEEIMDWYDNKRAPFGEGRKRNEFPDAFSLASLLTYARKSGVSIAVVAKDKDFEGACGFYSELLYFRSLPALTEALISADNRVEEVKKAIESEPFLIIEKIKEYFPDLSFYHEDDYETDVEDVEVGDIAINDIRVIHIGENEVSIAFEAKVDYSAYVRMDDHSTAAVDSSEDFYMVLHEYRGTVCDWTEISGIAKCSVSADWKMVKEVVMFEIQDEDVYVTERPEETYWEGEDRDPY